MPRCSTVVVLLVVVRLKEAVTSVLLLLLLGSSANADNEQEISVPSETSVAAVSCSRVFNSSEYLKK